jgi:iron complex outermembrane recepter protein
MNIARGSVLLLTGMCISAQAAENDGVLDEVVVTAQARQENLQSVPIAITAVNAEGLAAARVDSIAEIAAISPSIRFTTTNEPAASSKLQIRGLGTAGNNRAFEGSVGVFVDGVYRSRAGQLLQNWLDVESVQILRGPQGTLFGKNTSAGAFVMKSIAPSLQETGGNFELSAGNFGSHLVRSAFNAPLSEQSAVRVAALWSETDGFVENARGGRYNGNKNYAVKGQALWAPSEAMKLRFIADFARSNSNCCYGSVDYRTGPTQAIVNALSAALGNPLVSGDPDAQRSVLNFETDMDVRDRGAALIGEFNMLGGTLVSTSAYRKWNQEQLDGDADFSGADITSLDIFFQSRQLSQELVYRNQFGSRSDYVVGAYFADEKIEAPRAVDWGTQGQAYFDALLRASGLPAGFAQAPAGPFDREYMAGAGKSYAAFTHWIIGLSDPLKLVAGGRFTHEEKQGEFRYSFFSSVPRPALTVLGVAPGPAYDTTKDGDAVSGVLGLSYEVAPDVLSYATYSRGFKAGGVNLDSTAAGVVANLAAPLDPTFKPEYINGYELGLKTQYWGGRARTNVAVFYDDITDLQVAQVFGLRFAIINSPKAKLYGAEVENELMVSDRIGLQLAATFLPEANFGSDPALGLLVDRRFITAPRFSGSSAVNFQQPLPSSSLIATARAAVQYTGREYTNTASNEQQGSRSLLDLSFGLKSATETWNLSLYCQNCTDKRYVLQTFTTPLQTGDINAYIGAPRTYGLSVRGAF